MIEKQKTENEIIVTKKDKNGTANNYPNHYSTKPVLIGTCVFRVDT